MKHGINSVKLHISRISDCIREIILLSFSERTGREESEATVVQAAIVVCVEVTRRSM